jgi:hypothetical protein
MLRRSSESPVTELPNAIPRDERRKWLSGVSVNGSSCQCGDQPALEIDVVYRLHIGIVKFGAVKETARTWTRDAPRKIVHKFTLRCGLFLSIALIQSSSKLLRDTRKCSLGQRSLRFSNCRPRGPLSNANTPLALIMDMSILHNKSMASYLSVLRLQCQRH